MWMNKNLCPSTCCTGRHQQRKSPRRRSEKPRPLTPTPTPIPTSPEEQKLQQVKKKKKSDQVKGLLFWLSRHLRWRERWARRGEGGGRDCKGSVLHRDSPFCVQGICQLRSAPACWLVRLVQFCSHDTASGTDDCCYCSRKYCRLSVTNTTQLKSSRRRNHRFEQPTWSCCVCVSSSR